MKPDEGKVLKTNECRKLLRGTGVQGKFEYGTIINARSCGEGKGGKLTYETKWMQEVEKHIAGKGKIDIETRCERKKLLRDEG